MQHINLRNEKLAGVLILVVVVVALITPSASTTYADAQKLEATKIDIFSTEHWDSSRVEVLGFYLGMDRKAAEVNSVRYQLKLRRDIGGDCKERCQLCDSREVCQGIVLDFSSDDRIDGIEIVRIQGAAKVVTDAAAFNRFKGKTRQFFQDYSDAFRLRLLGKADSKAKYSEDPLYEGMMTYKYLSLGLRIVVAKHPPAPESESDLTVTFLQPVQQGKK